MTAGSKNKRLSQNSPPLMGGAGGGGDVGFEMICEEKLMDYWGTKARNFPLASEEGELTKSRETIASVKGMGVGAAGTSILEIGCGSGLMTMLLAREAILAFHGIPSILSPGAAEVFEMIEKWGRTPMRDTIHLVWDWECPVEEMLRDITRHIELYEVAPQTAMIEDTIRAHSPGGVVHLRNAVDLGIVCWRVDQ
jgi:hypothetical protein